MESQERRQEATERMFRRRCGMDEAKAQELYDYQAAQPDWYGTCRACGLKRRGTLADLAGPCPGCDGSTQTKADIPHPA
jgi:hypothetical protein